MAAKTSLASKEQNAKMASVGEIEGGMVFDGFTYRKATPEEEKLVVEGSKSADVIAATATPETAPTIEGTAVQATTNERAQK